jgi:hypothetical protein
LGKNATTNERTMPHIQQIVLEMNSKNKIPQDQATPMVE